MKDRLPTSRCTCTCTCICVYTIMCYNLILTVVCFPTQKYLHESRHRHAIKRHRGYSGRFSGKEQSQSPQKSPGTPIGGSIPPSASPGQSAPGVSDGGSHQHHQSIVRAGGSAGLFPLAGHYQNVTSTSGVAEDLMGAVMRQMHVVPEICAAGINASPSKSSQTVSLVPNQLGTSSLIESSVHSVDLTVSSAEHSAHQSLSDATIQGLINATRNFVVPILPPNMSPLPISPVAKTSVGVSSASTNSVRSLHTQPLSAASNTVEPDSTVPSVTQAST